VGSIVSDAERTRLRWRLVLGRYAKSALPMPEDEVTRRREEALDFLYAREYAGRGVRGPGSLDPSQLTVPRWLSEMRELFPSETSEIVERHALERYGMSELVTDPDVLSRLSPNMDLVKAILAFRGSMAGPVLEVARKIVAEVIGELRQRLDEEVRRTMAGKQDRFRHSPLKVAQNFDWRRTIRQNLRRWDPERRRLAVENVRFFSRIERRIPWEIVLAIDQSGSMTDSVIHSAVMASILAGLPSVRLKLFTFDTEIADLTDLADDPVEVLMNVQLGGGTNIGQAVAYAESLIENPHRTIVVLVTDFCEGASPTVLTANVRRLAESGVRMLGLAALDERARPAYDKGTAEELSRAGMEIAALTPKRFAEWLVKVL
jgi:Mg-chelatase subunit ChlD